MPPSSSPFLRFFAGLALVALLCVAFQEGFDADKEYQGQPDDIKKAVQARLEALRREEAEACRQRILDLADAKSDSFLMLNAQYLLGRDTQIVPARPPRPVRPDERPARDSSRVAPLLN